MIDTDTNDLLALLGAALLGADTPDLRDAIETRLEQLEISPAVAKILIEAAVDADKIREAIEEIAGLR